MPNVTPSSLEASLESAYRRQAVLYEQFLGLSADLPQLVASGAGSDDVFRGLKQVMDDISGIDAEVVVLRDQWKASGRRPGTGLAEALQSVEKLILQLLANVDTAERVAQESKKDLVPKICEENTRRKMRAAYASAARYEYDESPS